MPRYSQADSPLRLKVQDLGDDDLLLTAVNGTESLSALFRFELEMLAPADAPVDFDRVLGHGAVVAIDGPDGETRHVHGVIARFSEGDRGVDFVAYRAELVPSLWLLTLREQCRTFQHLSVPEILAECLAGLPVVYEIRGAFHARDYCVQYRESDFAFASRLMEEEGLYYYFRHGPDAGEMVVGDSPQGHEAIPGGRAVRFDEVAGGNREEARITRWHKVQEVSPGRVTLRDYCFEMPEKDLEADLGIQESVAAGQVTHTLASPTARDSEVYDYPGGYAQRFDGIDRGGAERPAELERIFEDNRRTAKLRMQEQASRALSIDGASDLPRLTAGHAFELGGHHHGDGGYVLTRVTHAAGLGGGGYASGGTPTLSYTNRFTALPAALPFVPARSTPRPTVRGTQTAVVVGPAGEEIFCDKYGRVKVQFHWDRAGRRDADSSCWIRVATIWAGKGYGVVHIPRIGQEVVVDFLEGDPDQPIIVGSVYNAEQMPPVQLPQERMFQGTRSNSSPGGGGFNGLVANDKKGKEMVTVNGQYDMSTHVGHDDKQVIDNDRTITVTGKHTETVKGATSVTVTAGAYSHDVAGSTASYHVKGKLSEFYDATQETLVGSDVSLQSKAGTITQEAVAGKFVIFGNSDVTVESGAASIGLTAATKIVLETGSSSIVMEADGTITISGVKVKIAGSAEASLGTGSQNVTTNTAKVAIGGAEINSSATGNHVVAGAIVKIN